MLGMMCDQCSLFVAGDHVPDHWPVLQVDPKGPTWHFCSWNCVHDHVAAQRLPLGAEEAKAKRRLFLRMAEDFTQRAEVVGND